MIINKTCEDCKHYTEINYFFGSCDVTHTDEPYCRPVDTCSAFKCVAFGKTSACEKCINRGTCYV